MDGLELPTWQKTKRFWIRVAEKTAADDLLTLAAAVSFYLSLSLSPFLLILLTALSILTPTLQDELVTQVAVITGETVSEAVGLMIERMRQTTGRSLSLVSLVSFVTLAVSASGVFSQLRLSLDKIICKPEISNELPGERSYALLLWSFLKERLFMVAVVMTFILMSVVSLVASSVIGFLVDRFDMLGIRFAEHLNNMISFFVFTIFFSSIFCFVPRRKISWASGLQAGIVTALLFVAGKVLIGAYLSSSAMASIYAAAGSLIALLIWVYYSALIIFWGAEVANEIQNCREIRLMPITVSSQN